MNNSEKSIWSNASFSLRLSWHSLYARNFWWILKMCLQNAFIYFCKLLIKSIIVPSFCIFTVLFTFIPFHYSVRFLILLQCSIPTKMLGFHHLLIVHSKNSLALFYSSIPCILYTCIWYYSHHTHKNVPVVSDYLYLWSFIVLIYLLWTVGVQFT